MSKNNIANDNAPNDNVTTVAQVLKNAAICKHENRPDDALKLYNTILQRYPDNIDGLYGRAKLFLANNNAVTALSDFIKLLDLSKSQHILYASIGDCYSQMREIEKAVESYIKAIDIKPDFETPYIPLITLMERMGRLDEANAILNKGLSLMPDEADLYYLQSKIFFKNKDYKSAAGACEKTIELAPNHRGKHIILGDFARLKEKLKDYDGAMEVCIEAQIAASKTQSAISTSADNNNLIIDKSRQWFAPENISGWDKEEFTDKIAPVFLVGFPRSGTTLMEQVLFAHPNLTVTDEVQVLQAKMVYIDKVIGRHIEFPQGYNTLTNAELQAWRDEYFAAMARSLPDLDPNLRIVDKNPMSFAYLGTINRFFPESPVLMMIRDPRDVILSCFFQTFAPNSDTIHFYSLADTVEYYAKTMDLYLHLRDNLSLNILQVKYEDMIADFEPHARRIIDHIGEPWDDAILTYYQQENHRYIQTPSYEAVTKPMHNKAVGKWQNYAQYFVPHMKKLQPYLKEFGYEL